MLYYIATIFCPDLHLLFKLDQFSLLILMKIIKIVATRCHILRLKLKMHQIRFRLGDLTVLPHTS